MDVHLWLPREMAVALGRLARKRKSNRRDLTIEAISAYLKLARRSAGSPSVKALAVDTQVPPATGGLETPGSIIVA